MGSSSSKFRKHLQNGDEYAALQLYNSSSDLRKGLDPNVSYGDSYNHDTPLHYGARHAMKSLLRICLHELGGNPNKKNSRNETVLHSVCMAHSGRGINAEQRRLDCVLLILQWRGAKLKDGEVERVDLGAQDEKQNTALHYAAASGLRRCVEVLVSQGAPLFVENGQKQTPCDCAEKCNHGSIALYLESKMVFSNDQENTEEVEEFIDTMEGENYSGLRAQDLQEAKDQLLVETSDMLRVPLFTAEALLRNHEWSRETLLESWMDDPIACCEKCGVNPPAILFEDQPSTSTAQPIIPLDHDLTTPTRTAAPSIDTICDICACLMPPTEDPVSMACEHQFCRLCWKRYLTVKIEEGEAHNITCPGYNCTKLVPVEVIETVVSRDMARRYLQFDIKAFVESNPSIKWCPYPGCGRAVRLPDADTPASPLFTSGFFKPSQETSHAVDCGNGHFFCWECLGEAHEPASCENWKRWHQKIGEIKPEECLKQQSGASGVNGTAVETESAANCLWLVTNSKPCPNCKSPIQKNEGCNHMKCSKCKHDFCWVCLEGWKKHSSATGGYFRCNRYEVVRKVEEHNNMLKTEAEARNKKMQELNRFVHYYSRFKNHEHSFKLEEPLLSTAKAKMMVLAKAVTDPETANTETKFVEDAVQQLLKARRTLKCSYVYGYYLDDSGYMKTIFEFMQTELEECTETLSEMIARPYLRTKRSKIIQTAHLVQRKRHEFVSAIAKGLIPPDTSPTLKKKRKKFSVELDDDLRKALIASLQDLDPANPWVKDPSGKHTNVTALLDWPEESDESDSEDNKCKKDKDSGETDGQEDATSADVGECAEDPEGAEMMAVVAPATCVREGCERPRAQNPRTGEVHDHCSIRCMRMDHLESNQEEQEGGNAVADYHSDYQMDLLRALEMSRLQFLREMGSLKPGTGSDSSFEDRDLKSTANLSSPGELDVTNPISPRSPRTFILMDPPKGRGRSPSPATRGGQEEVVQYDSYLESPRMHRHAQDDDPDLRLAIQLSLQEAEPSRLSKESSGQSQHQCTSHDPFSEQYSTIVTRVPNKSVEDLASVDTPKLSPREHGGETEVPKRELSEEATGECLGACGGTGVVGAVYDTRLTNENVWSKSGDSRLTNEDVWTMSGDSRRTNEDVWTKSGDTAEVSPSGGAGAPWCKPNIFGVIKDLSVTNILASDNDKTKDFNDKNFSQLYAKEAGDLENVFEPRPNFSVFGKDNVRDSPDTTIVTTSDEHWFNLNSGASSYGNHSGVSNQGTHSGVSIHGNHSSTPPQVDAVPTQYNADDSDFHEQGMIDGAGLDAVLRSLSRLTSRLSTQDDDDVYGDQMGFVDVADNTALLPDREHPHGGYNNGLMLNNTGQPPHTQETEDEDADAVFV